MNITKCSVEIYVYYIKEHKFIAQLVLGLMFCLPDMFFKNYELVKSIF